MAETQEDRTPEEAPSTAVTIGLYPVAIHSWDMGGGIEAGDSRAVTVNFDPVAKHSWEWRPPGPETEKLRKLIKGRFPIGELERLATLMEKGLISEAEFQRAKEKLLRD